MKHMREKFASLSCIQVACLEETKTVRSLALAA